jgi:bacteriocin-like protein
VSAKAMRHPLCLQQEIDMNTFEYEANQLSDDELDTVSGGRIKWSDIHMDYKAQLDLRNTDPPPTRYA